MLIVTSSTLLASAGSFSTSSWVCAIAYGRIQRRNHVDDADFTFAVGDVDRGQAGSRQRDRGQRIADLIAFPASGSGLPLNVTDWPSPA
jgi:hypothetical protein